MNPRLSQLLGIIFVIISCAMTLIVYQGTLDVGEQELFLLISSFMVHNVSDGEFDPEFISVNRLMGEYNG